MKKVLNIILVFLMSFLFVGCASNVQEQTNQQASSHSILIVEFVKDDEETESDQTQGSNALNNGGQLMVIMSEEGYTNVFTDVWKNYGAEDSDGNYYSFGAVLNYIASFGWNLVQTDFYSSIFLVYFSK